MEEKKLVEFLKNAGGCVVSKNVLTGKGRVKWLLRESPVDEIDNGWRVFSDIDDDAYINNSDNLEVCDFNVIINIEPALFGIYLLSVGSDLQLLIQDGKISFLDNKTGKKVEPLYKNE